MRGKGLITTFPNRASSVPRCMRVRLGMTDKGTNREKQLVLMYQRIPTHSLNLSLSFCRLKLQLSLSTFFFPLV